MNYTDIDPIINDWKKRHSLHVGTEIKETAIRMAEIVSPAGEMFQIWIDVPDEHDEIGVHVWDHKSRKRDWLVPVSRLGFTLDESIKTAKLWMRPIN